MKIQKRIILLFSVLMIMSIVLSGCTNDNGNNNPPTGENQPVTEDIEKTKPDSPAQNSETMGRIVKIDDAGVHVQVGDKVETYKVESSRASKHYIGETIGVKQLDDINYDIFTKEDYDYVNRYTSTGDPIKRVMGTIENVANDTITAVTDAGNVIFSNPGNFNMESGAAVMFDYVEMPGGNQLVSFYDEASKIIVKVQEISRDSSGMMKIKAVQMDNKEYEINVTGDTVVNFSHSELKNDDEITVYPKDMNGDVPAVVEAKLIIKK